MSINQRMKHEPNQSGFKAYFRDPQVLIDVSGTLESVITMSKRQQRRRKIVQQAKLCSATRRQVAVEASALHLQVLSLFPTRVLWIRLITALGLIFA